MVWEIARVSLEVISLWVRVYVLGSFPGCLSLSTPKNKTFNFEASKIAGPNNLATWFNQIHKTVNQQKQNIHVVIQNLQGEETNTGTNGRLFLLVGCLLCGKRGIWWLEYEVLSSEGRTGAVDREPISTKPKAPKKSGVIAVAKKQVERWWLKSLELLEEVI